MIRSSPFRKIRRRCGLSAAMLMLHLSSSTGSAAEPPLTLTAGPIAAGRIPFTWTMKSGKSYELQHSTQLAGDWAAVDSPLIPTIATTVGPITVSASTGGPRHFYRVRENASPFDPPWADVEPLRTIHLSATATFSQLLATIQSLLPGDRLMLGAGTHHLTGKLSIRLQGTAAAPIRIEAAPGAQVVFSRSDALQNLLDLGETTPTRYLSIRNIRFTGGSVGLRLVDCSNVWIDGCTLLDTASSGITAIAASTHHLYITRNDISATGESAEGIYLGSASGTSVTSDSIVALNHIHDTPVPTGGSGAGIFVRQGSSGNRIAANVIHDTGGPCIFIGGTGGLAINTVEGNLCFRSEDDGLFVLGDGMVRNNLVVVGETGNHAFRSAINGGFSPTRLTVVNNTFISGSSDAVRLANWETGSAMVFANNACYSKSGMAVRAVTVPTGTTFAGNIGLGTLSAGVTGFQPGTGLADFTDVTWDASRIDARPAGTSPLRGAADTTHVPPVDLNFLPRTAPHATGSHRP